MIDRRDKYRALLMVARSQGEKPALELLPHLLGVNEDMQAPLVKPEFVGLISENPKVLKLLKPKSPKLRALITKPENIELLERTPGLVDVVDSLRLLEFKSSERSCAEVLFECLDSADKRTFFADKKLGEKFSSWFGSKDQALIGISIEALARGDFGKIEAVLAQGRDAVKKDIALDVVERFKRMDPTPVDTTVPVSFTVAKSRFAYNKLATWVGSMEKFKTGREPGGFNAWYESSDFVSIGGSDEAVEQFQSWIEAAYRNTMNLRVLFSRDREKLKGDMNRFGQMLEPEELSKTDGFTKLGRELKKFAGDANYTSDEKAYLSYGVYSSIKYLSSAGLVDSSREEVRNTMAAACRIVVRETAERETARLHSYSYNDLLEQREIIDRKLETLGLEELEGYVARIDVNSSQGVVGASFAQQLIGELTGRDIKQESVVQTIRVETDREEEEARRLVDLVKAGRVREAQKYLSHFQGASLVVVGFGDDKPKTPQDMIQSMAANPNHAVRIMRVRRKSDWDMRIHSITSMIEEDKLEQLERTVEDLWSDCTSKKVKPEYLSEYAAYFRLVCVGLQEKMNSGSLSPEALRIGLAARSHQDELDDLLDMRKKGVSTYPEYLRVSYSKTPETRSEFRLMQDVIREACGEGTPASEKAYRALCSSGEGNRKEFILRLRRLAAVGGAKEQRVGILLDIMSKAEADNIRFKIFNLTMPNEEFWLRMPETMAKESDIALRLRMQVDHMTPDEEINLLSFLCSRHEKTAYEAILKRLEHPETTGEGLETRGEFVGTLAATDAVRDAVHMLDLRDYDGKEMLIHKIKALQEDGTGWIASAAIAMKPKTNLPSEMELLAFSDMIDIEISNPDAAKVLRGFTLPHIAMAAEYTELTSELKELSPDDREFYKKAREIRENALKLSQSMTEESQRQEFRRAVEGIEGRTLGLSAEESEKMSEHVGNFALMKGDCNMVLVDFLGEVLDLGVMDDRLGRKYFEIFTGDRIAFDVNWKRKKIRNETRARDEG